MLCTMVCVRRLNEERHCRVKSEASLNNTVSCRLAQLIRLCLKRQKQTLLLRVSFEFLPFNSFAIFILFLAALGTSNMIDEHFATESYLQPFQFQYFQF